MPFYPARPPQGDGGAAAGWGDGVGYCHSTAGRWGGLWSQQGGTVGRWGLWPQRDGAAGQAMAAARRDRFCRPTPRPAVRAQAAADPAGEKGAAAPLQPSGRRLQARPQPRRGPRFRRLQAPLPRPDRGTDLCQGAKNRAKGREPFALFSFSPLPERVDTGESKCRLVTRKAGREEESRRHGVGKNTARHAKTGGRHKNQAAGGQTFQGPFPHPEAILSCPVAPVNGKGSNSLFFGRAHKTGGLFLTGSPLCRAAVRRKKGWKLRTGPPAGERGQKPPHRGKKGQKKRPPMRLHGGPAAPG